MKVDQALQFAQALKQAAAKAVAEGRDELTKGDLDTFTALDDEARAELDAAIRRSASAG